MSEGQLLAYLDDELAGAERSEVAAHLTSCGECETGLRDLEAISAEFHDAVSWLEVAVPLDRALGRFEEARREAAAAPVTPLRPAPVTPLRPAPVTPLRTRRLVRRLTALGMLKAAALAALLAGAASAAIDGSPVREWVETVLGIGDVEPMQAPSIEPVQTPVETPTVEPVQEPVPDPVLRDLPERGRIQVRLSDVGGRVIVRYVEDEAASIRPVNQDIQGGFSSAGVLELRLGGGGDVYVDIPLGVQNARVEVNGRLYLEKRNGATTTHAPIQESTGTVFSFPPRS